MNPTLYDVLGVAPDASTAEIKKAWRDAADRFEPGSGSSSKQFRLFNEAAEVLLDPERRKAYDAEIIHHEARSGDEPPVATGPLVAGAPVPGTSKATSEAAAATATAAAPPGSRQGVPEERTERPTSEVAEGAPGDRGSAGRGVPLPVLAVLGVLAAVAVGFAAYFGFASQRAEAYQDALDTAPSAAERAAVAVLSYDYESLEADRDAASRFLTEDYRKEYVETFDKLVRDNAEKTRAKVDAQVLASSAMVQSGDRSADSIPVLLFVNQTTVSTANAGEPQTALNRVKLDMENVDGTWLVDDITSY